MSARGLEGWSCLGRDELEAAAAHIAENGVRLLVLMVAVEVDVLAHVRVGREEVFETIVIKVERADTPPCQPGGGKSDAGLPGDIGEEPAADVAALMREAQRRVRAQFRIELENEVALVGEGFE